MHHQLAPTVNGYGSLPVQNLDARAQVWAFVFDCYRKKEAATSPVNRSDEAVVKNTEGVSHVDRRPD